MCGRFSMHIPAKSIAEFFLTLNLQDQQIEPRYNIAPTQGVLAVLCAPSQPKQRRAMYLHWGLIPSWAKDCKIAAKLTNARSETLREKPSFRGAYQYRRCLLPASGFFEWMRTGKHKQPMYITGSQQQPLALAGLWEHWSGAEGEEISSVTIITTEPNKIMEPIHDRMPVILARRDFDAWLDPGLNDTRLLDRLLRPCPESWLETWPVSAYVSNFRNQGPRCIERIPEEKPPIQTGLFD